METFSPPWHLLSDGMSCVESARWPAQLTDYLTVARYSDSKVKAAIATDVCMAVLGSSSGNWEYNEYNIVTLVHPGVVLGPKADCPKCLYISADTGAAKHNSLLIAKS